MNPWSRWASFIARREGAESLALARIITGVTIAKSFTNMAFRGVARAAWVDVEHGGVRKLDAGWVGWFGGLTPGNVNALITIGVVAAILMALGAFSRASTIVTFGVFRSLAIVNPLMRDASDRLLISVLFLLMLSGAGGALSVDAWLEKRKNVERPPVLAWPRYVAILQLGIMYSMTVAQKVSTGWIPGGPLDELWYILQEPSWQRFSMRWLAPYFPLTRAMTLVVWLFELSSPLLLLSVFAEETTPRGGSIRRFLRRIHFRDAYLCLGVLLHVGITVLLDIQQFLGGVMAIYACCICPSAWRGVWQRLSFLRRAGKEKQVTPV